MHNQPGVTRDWLSSKLPNADLVLVDTAGMEHELNGKISSRAWQRSVEKISESQLVLFVVDGKAGLLPDDQLLAKQLRKTLAKEKIMLLINKAENLSVAEAITEFQPLGFSNWQVISAVHGIGISALRNLLENLGEDVTENEAVAPPIKIALFGRPNVGKSTFVNRILGKQRMLVADQPGTTVDSVDTEFEYEQRKLVLIDTSGLRRRANAREFLEKQGGIQARNNVKRAGIVIFMADASEGVVHQDQQLAKLICGYGKATLILLNKIDLVPKEKRNMVVRQARLALPYMEFAQLMTVSAAGRQFSRRRVLNTALKSLELANQRNTPKQITKILRRAVSEIEPPRSHGKRPSLRYAHQAGNNPILIVIHGRHVDLIKEPYQRYLTRRFTASLGFSGAPLHIRFKESSGKPARFT